MIKRLDYVDNLFDDDFVARVATKYHDNLFYYAMYQTIQMMQFLQ